MWLPVILLALMASGSACPDLCECHPGTLEPALVDVTCRGQVPMLTELPVNSGSVVFDGVDEDEVMSFFEELEEFDSFDALERPYESMNFSVNVSANALLQLGELALTNCSLVSLNVSWRGLERVRTLNLSCNNLAQLSDARTILAMNLSSLMRLDLSDNLLSYVSAGNFRTLKGLVHLSLRGNIIGTVHEDAFRGLDHLELLDFSDNRLTDLPDSALTPLYSLQKLDLSGNQLQVLGARWFESLDRLRELDVSRNGLARAASGTLQPLSGLSVLRLAENPLKERDVSLLLGTGRRLEVVDASRTGLARVPAALTRSVRALRLAGNKLTTIRSGDLDSYPLLRILDISDNKLVDIEEDALGRLEVLEELDVSGNALIKIPRSLPASLTVLKLERNAITSLKFDDLQGLYNLRSLMLNRNDIGEIEVGSLRQLPVLDTLDLSDNPIKVLPANALSGPSNLGTLRMSGLISLRREQQQQSDMAFPVSTPDRLVVLDVSRSPILAGQLLADDAALSACKSLLELNLSETNLTSLRSDLPYMLPRLRTLFLTGNDWNCTEDMFWLGEWLRQRKEFYKDVEQPRCTEPEELAGLFLYELPSPTGILPITVPSTTVALLALTVGHVTEQMAGSNEPNLSLSSSTENILTSDTDFSTTSSTTETTIPTEQSMKQTLESSSLPVKPNSTIFDRIQPTPEISQIFEAPTSFRNITSSGSTQNNQVQSRKSNKSQRLSGIQNWLKDTLTPTLRRGNDAKVSVMAAKDEPELRTFDNQVDVSERQKNDRSNKLFALPGEIGSANSKSSKVGFRRAEQEEGRLEPKQTTEKHSTGLKNLTKENLIRKEPDGNASSEELSGRATDSGARVSEPMSPGAHPGMLVLAGAALGAAAALTVVLSRRATVRRRDRYHRHENIEVHTLTPTAELW